MSKIESEAPPAYSPYERNATSDQIAADSDTRNLNNHIAITISLARDTYRSCIQYLEAFNPVAHDVAALFALLEVIIENIAEYSVNHEIVESTTKLLSASEICIANLQALVTKYEDLSTASQRVWRRTMGESEELVSLRGQLGKHLDSFSALNKTIASISLKGVLAMVRKFMTEVDRGQRKESIMSKKGPALNVEDITTRVRIQHELEDVGITPHIFDQYHVLILQTLIGTTERDPPQAFAKAPHRESYVAKALQKFKPKRSSPKGLLSISSSEKPPSSDPSNTTKEPLSLNPSEKPPPSGPSNTTKPETTKSHNFGTKADLFSAIGRDDLSLVQELLDQGLDIESRDEVNGGQTPLIKAVGYDKVDIAELLLLRGANADAKTTNSEETALICASSSGRYEIILLILEHGSPDLEARDRNGRTALMRACAKGYDQEVKALVKAGADTEAKDKNNGTALTEALRFGHIETVDLIRKLGRKTNQRREG